MLKLLGLVVVAVFVYKAYKWVKANKAAAAALEAKIAAEVAAAKSEVKKL